MLYFFLYDYAFISGLTTLLLRSLDCYIVGACMHLLNISDIDDEPARKQPLFEILSKEDHHRYIYSLAKEILELQF